MGETKVMGILIDSCKKAVEQFFSSMCPIDIRFQKTVFDKPDILKNKYDVISVVGFSGDCKGSGAINVSRVFAEHVTKTLLGMETVSNQEEVTDTVGELGNICIGGMKTIASSSGIDFEIACPTVIAGSSAINLEPAKGTNIAVLEYSFEDKSFAICLTLVEE